MTAPTPYPGDPGAEYVEAAPTPVGPNLNRSYHDAIGRPLTGRLIVTPSVGPSFDLPIVDGYVARNLVPDRYVVVADLRDADGKAHYQTEVVVL